MLHHLMLALVAAAPGYDLILAGGRVLDGTGAPAFEADVGISGDRIVAVGDLSKATAVRRVDVAGLVVAPGFIDMLGQSDHAVLIDNRLESKVRQGITTEIVGEGNAVAPVDPTLLAEWAPYIAKYGSKVDWADLDGYRRRFEAGRSTINMATFIGATNVRRVVLGAGDVQPTAGQLEQMQAVLERQLEQGALGLSTGLIYPPATYATTRELVALAKATARHGGIYATHLRSEADGMMAALEEALTIGREAHIPVEIWHLKLAGRDNWGRMKEVLARLERARAEGIDVTANVYPYTAAMNGLAASVPAWAQAGGTGAMLGRLRDPALRRRIARELWNGTLGRETPEGIQLVGSPVEAVKAVLGKTLSEVARERRQAPEEVLLDLLLESEGKLSVIRHVMDEGDLQLALVHPWVSFATDSAGTALDGPFGPDRNHPRAFGSMPRVLGHYVRQLKLLRLEEAVRKMTSLPASRVRLLDRGVVRPGMVADLTIFDPERVVDVATYDDPKRFPVGIQHVVVNGRLVLDGGVLTSERPGRLLRPVVTH